ncbi:Papain family cysteine protease [compost metagenome]
MVFAIDVYESFAGPQAAQTGQIPMPDMSREKRLGAHALLCVGFDDASQTLIIRNSWGSNWGHGGYAYLPYAYVQQGLVKDGWTARL